MEVVAQKFDVIGLIEMCLFVLKVMAVKKNIEDVQGKDNYPCGQQLLIHNGKVLKDETTLAENKVTEDGFLVVMLSKVFLLLHNLNCRACIIISTRFVVFFFFIFLLIKLYQFRFVVCDGCMILSFW